MKRRTLLAASAAATLPAAAFAQAKTNLAVLYQKVHFSQPRPANLSPLRK